MPVITADHNWARIAVDTDKGVIGVQQDWNYTWTVQPGVSAWTDAEKSRFQREIDKQVWKAWNNKIKIKVACKSASLAKKFKKTEFSLLFDTRPVAGGGHWKVNVRKLPAGSTPTTYISNVRFSRREINLDSGDIPAYNASNAAGKSNPNFLTIPHEFGHTMDNPDEYNGGPHLADWRSIMNVGNEVRRRHVHLVVKALNKMFPGCTFTAA